MELVPISGREENISCLQGPGSSLGKGKLDGDHCPTPYVCPNGVGQTFPGWTWEGEGGLPSPAAWMGNNDPLFIASSIVPENPF